VIGATLRAMAIGRLALGTISLTSPAAAARSFGIEDEMTPELSYMARIFGSRAIALGSGYLLSGGDSRRLWQRLAFVCDLSDTVTGAGHVRRRDLPGRTGVALTALTGAYAAFGAARIAADALER
jgi:hypothetical protein